MIRRVVLAALFVNMAMGAPGPEDQDCGEGRNGTGCSATDRNAANNRPMQLEPLGRPVTLGAMYDATTDMFFEDTSFWTHQTIQKKKIYNDKQQSVMTEVNLMKTVKERLDYLKVNAALKLSFMGGLIKVSGSAGFLSDKVSNSNEVNVNLKYHTKKYKEYIPISTPMDNTGFCKNKLYTHAVTSITYGMDAHFVFKKLVTEKKDIQEVEGNLKVMINAIPGIKIEGEASLNLKSQDLKTIEGTTLKMYGDFSPSEPLPTSYEEAVRFYKKLSTLTGTRDNKYVGAAPLVVRLTPVSMLCTGIDRVLNSISNSAIDKVVKMIDELQALDMRAGELLSRRPAIMFEPVRKNLNVYRNALYEYTSNVKAELKDLLPKIRGGEGALEIDLLKLTSDWKSSQFVSSASGKYLENREREIGSIELLLKNFPSSGVTNIAVVDFASANDNEFLLNRDKLIVGEINVLSLPRGTEEFLKGKSDSIVTKHWYDDLATVGRLGYAIRNLAEFALANKEKDDRGYMIKLLPIDDGTPMRVKAYFRGQEVSSNYTVQEQAPQVTKEAVGSSFIELNIKRPMLASVSGCTVVLTKVGGMKQTRDFKFTKPNQETFKLNGLSPFSTYELTVAYKTNMGISPSTMFTMEAATAITTAPTSPPQNIIVQKRSFNLLAFQWESPMTVAAGIKDQDIYYEISLQGPGGYSRNLTTKELQLTVDSLNDASLYKVYISASVKNDGTVYTSGQVSEEMSTAPLPLFIIQDMAVPITKNAVGVKWTKPIRMPVGATVNSYTVEYNIMGSVLTPKKMTVHGGSSNAQIRDLTMGTTYEFKVKMDMGMLGESEYSSGLVVKTLESLTDMEKLEKKLWTANNELQNKISSLENNARANKNELQNKISLLENNAIAYKVKSQRSAICGFKRSMYGGVVTYEKVRVEVNEVGSSLAPNGYYTAGVTGVYEVSVSGFAAIERVQSGGVRIALKGTGAAGTDRDYFVESRTKLGGDTWGWVHDNFAGTSYVKLTKGQQIHLQNTDAGRVDYTTFCVTLYAASQVHRTYKENISAIRPRY